MVYVRHLDFLFHIKCMERRETVLIAVYRSTYICNEDLSCKGIRRLIKYKYYYHTFPSYIYVSTFPIVHHMLQIDINFRQRSNRRTSDSVAGVRRGRLLGKELHVAGLKNRLRVCMQTRRLRRFEGGVVRRREPRALCNVRF